MERIQLYKWQSKDKTSVRLRFRLVDGRKVNLYHKTGYVAKAADLNKFEKDGSLKPHVTVYNSELKGEILRHMSAMEKAYAKMKEDGLDMTSDVFELEIQKYSILSWKFVPRRPKPYTSGSSVTNARRCAMVSSATTGILRRSAMRTN